MEIKQKNEEEGWNIFNVTIILIKRNGWQVEDQRDQVIPRGLFSNMIQELGVQRRQAQHRGGLEFS